MKRILVNAAQEEELRVALVDGQRLYDLDIEIPSKASKKANVYKGKVTRVEPSLEAAFVDFGAARHGFLPWKEISDQYRNDNGKAPIREGAEVIVQVEKEERGNKGAALSTYVSLAGRYLVLMPNNPRLGGISRRIEGEERAELKEALRSLEIPDNMGLIVRTAGVGTQARELQWDLDYLLKLWQAIQEVGGKKRAPVLIHQESNVIIRAIRDYLRDEIGEVVFDTSESYEEAMLFVRQVMPQYESRIKLHEDRLPLFNRFQIENQIESAFGRDVVLPSGGTLSIDPTEALVAIDINSSRSTRGADIEETALTTNLEAADEIARQLRLRDIGGLIVIDFIDMSSNQHQRLVENRMREALEADRAKVQISRISRFGLLEMSRQRLRASLDETSSIVCPRCSGQGRVRDAKSLALSIIRIVREEANKDKNREIRVAAPLDVAAYLLNEKREEVAAVEEESGSSVMVLPAADLVTPHYRINGVNTRGEQYEVDNTEIHAAEVEIETPAHQPAVNRGAIDQARQQPPAPQSSAAASGPVASLVSAVRSLFGGGQPDEAGHEARQEGGKAATAKADARPPRERGSRGRGRGGDNRGKSDGRRQSQGRGRGEGRGEGRGKGDSRKRDETQQEEAQRKSSSGRGGRQRQGPARDSGRKPAAKAKAEPVQSEAATGGEAAEETKPATGKARRRPAAKRTRNTSQRKRGPRGGAGDEAGTADDLAATEAAAARKETAEVVTPAAEDQAPAPETVQATAQATATGTTEAREEKPAKPRRRSPARSRRPRKKAGEPAAAPEASTTEEAAATAVADESRPPATTGQPGESAQQAQEPGLPPAQPQAAEEPQPVDDAQSSEQAQPQAVEDAQSAEDARAGERSQPQAVEEVQSAEDSQSSERAKPQAVEDAQSAEDSQSRERAKPQAVEDAQSAEDSQSREQPQPVAAATAESEPAPAPDTEPAPVDEAKAEPAKPKRTRKAAPAKKRTTRKTNAAKEKPASADEAQPAAADVAAAETPAPPAEPATPEPDPAPEASPADQDEQAAAEVAAKPKPARKRTRTRKKKAEEPAPAAQAESPVESQAESPVATKTEPAANPKDPAPASAPEPPAPEAAASKPEAASKPKVVSAPDPAPTAVSTPGRAPNDPREVRRRQLAEKAANE